ncbi:MAG: site-specific DNA-methyltransferase [Bacteroidaceae bacterium]|nr:site-specific DNA-methyltransferase [Bacteroidaceae bacterium]
MAVGVVPINKQVQKLSVEPKSEINFVQTSWCQGDGIKRLYHADNIDVLTALLDDNAVCGNVTLIYIDPPYNTGGAFETRDFKHAYNDRFTFGNYLDFMRKRLELMYSLLSDQGSIYVHLDNKMVFHVKVMMDEIFGIQNFKSMITRKKCKSKNFTRKTYGNISDYILFYSKTDYPVWNRPYEDWSDEKILKEYPYVEEETGRRYKKVPIHAPGVRNGATGEAWRGLLPPVGKHWQYTPDKLEEMDRNGEIYWSQNGNPRRKVYLDCSRGIPVQDIWLDYLDVDNQNTLVTGYPTEKNLDMLKLIVETSSRPGDIVLDCFAGSGTTLVAAEELGRQWIGVDIGNEAISTIVNRFKYGRKPMGDYVGKSANTKMTLTLFQDEDFEDDCVKDEFVEETNLITYDFFEEA